MSLILTNKLGIVNDVELSLAEGEYSNARISELIENPILGNFDVKHLKAIHFHIFQDIYHHAGNFHESTEIRTKNRVSEVTNQRYQVFYPPIEIGIDKIDILLNNFASQFINASFPDLMNLLIDTYAQLDYFHVFTDGNSRTLRLFIKSAANECGLDLDWGTSNVNGLSRLKRKMVYQYCR